MATKEENERLAVVETKVDGIAADVAEIKSTLLGLDNKYAAKWVQSAVAFVVGIIVSAVLVALIALVVIKPGANNPTTTTTTNTPTGSTSTTKDGTPSASATSNATATPENPSVTDTQSSDGGVNIDIPKVTP